MLSLLLKLSPRILEPSSIKFLSLCISTSLPSGHAWNFIVMSALVLLVASWNCEMNYKNGYAGLLVLRDSYSNRDYLRAQSNLEKKVKPSILKDDLSSRADPSIFTIAPVL